MNKSIISITALALFFFINLPSIIAQDNSIAQHKANVITADPIAKLGKKGSGTISLVDFKAQKGITAIVENLDKTEGFCTILSYTMTVVPVKADPTDAPSKKGKFEGTILNLANTVKTGDAVYFDSIKCKCSGDTEARKINSLVFKIK